MNAVLWILANLSSNRPLLWNATLFYWQWLMVQRSDPNQLVFGGESIYRPVKYEPGAVRKPRLSWCSDMQPGNNMSTVFQKPIQYRGQSLSCLWTFKRTYLAKRAWDNGLYVQGFRKIKCENVTAAQVNIHSKSIETVRPLVSFSSKLKMFGFDIKR